MAVQTKYVSHSLHWFSPDPNPSSKPAMRGRKSAPSLACLKILVTCSRMVPHQSLTCLSRCTTPSSIPLRISTRKISTNNSARPSSPQNSRNAPSRGPAQHPLQTPTSSTMTSSQSSANLTSMILNLSGSDKRQVRFFNPSPSFA